VSDRFFSPTEFEVFDGLMREVMKKQLGIANQDEVLKKVNIFTAFSNSNYPNCYMPVDSMDQLKSVVEMKLLEYNESLAMMDLVLFEQAIEHITRISRIILNPSGMSCICSSLRVRYPIQRHIR
jgi:dynein heavy chain